MREPAHKYAVYRRIGRVDVWATRAEATKERKEHIMVALVVLLLILAIFGGLGFAAHVLWFVLLIAVALWLLGFVMGGVDTGVGRRRWYGRW
jgi:preprotein translocase subunit SecE